MALQNSGAISSDNIQTEHGGVNPISLSEYYGADKGVPTSGTIAFSDFYGTSDPPDISSASYDSVSLNVSPPCDQPTGVAFSEDGVKMYLVDNSKPDAVYQYTLSTAWNVGTASYDSVSYDLTVSPFGLEPQAIKFSDDGTKMYIIEAENDRVYQHDLSTAWDLATASYNSTSVLVSGQDSAGYGLAFSPDGTKMFIAGNVNDRIYQYTLSTAWNVGTASYDSVSFYIGSQETNITGVDFSDNGKKMYIVGYDTASVYQYTLSTAWNVGTASYDSVSIDVSAQGPVPADLFFSADQSKMYTAGFTAQDVFQYSV